MLMAKNDLRLIIQGGVLCAAFSFMGLFLPVIGVIANYMAMFPILYTGLILGVRGFTLAVSIPLSTAFCLFGINGLLIYAILLVAPVLAILHWYFLKTNTGYTYSLNDILHLLTRNFLIVVVFSFIYLTLIKPQFFSQFVLESLEQKITAISQISKISAAPQTIIAALPGVFAFLWLLMVWCNFKMAYHFALKRHGSVRQPALHQSRYLRPIWDIIMVAAIWLVLLNDIWINSTALHIFARTIVCIGAFPLLIDGIEIIQLIANSRKLPPYLFIFLAVMTFMLVWPLIFVVVLGLVDPWYDLKQKYLKKLN